MTAKLIIGVFFGGTIGTLLRYLLIVFFDKFRSIQFPLRIFVPNMLGSFLIGLLIPLLKTFEADVFWDKFLITGFLGSLTTFSSFGFELERLFFSRDYLYFALYFFASLLLGLLLFIMGWSISNEISTLVGIV